MPTRAGKVETFESGKSSRVVMLGYREDGSRRRVRVTEATPEAVEAEISRLRAEQRAGTLTDQALERRTVKEHLETWLEERKGTVGYKAWRRNHYAVHKQLIPQLGRYSVAELSTRPALVRAAYRRLLAGGLAPLTVRRAHDALRLAMKQALDDRIITELVTSRVRVTSTPRHPTWALSAEEANRLLAGESPYRPLWLTLLYTGLRLGELLALRPSDITQRADGRADVEVRRTLDTDESGATLFKEFPKTNAGRRTITVPAGLAAVLAECQARGTATLFATKRGTPFTPSNVNHYLHRDAEAATPPLVWPDRSLHPHILRHTFASALLAENRPLPEVAYLLGHASPDISLRVYAHFVRSDTSAAADALEARYGPSPEPPKATQNGVETGVTPQTTPHPPATDKKIGPAE